MQLSFVTGNKNKVHSATVICAEFGVKIEQVKLEISEIQGEDGALIVRDKAQKAYDLLQKPLVVTDDSWSIHGLNGFPGAYMKSMNQWLSVDDWVRLTKDLADRRLTLHQYLVFQDDTRQQLLHVDIPGELLLTPRGAVDDEPFATIATVTGTKTIAQLREQGKSSLEKLPSVWHELGRWLHATFPDL